MEEIEEGLSKDSRYHVLEVFSDDRADLLMAYLEELERDPQLNSLFSSHRENGDMARSHGMLKVMKQRGLPSSQGDLPHPGLRLRQGRRLAGDGEGDGQVRGPGSGL